MSVEEVTDVSEDETLYRDKHRQKQTNSNRPIKALKSCFERKLSKQESRLTAVENNMQETDEFFNGNNLNDIFASSGPKLAIKLAKAIKGDNLKDCVP